MTGPWGTNGPAQRAPNPVRRALLRLGLPRAPAGGRHLMAFLVVAVLTVLVTRGALAASGYPQVGGSGLHLSHALWGGLLMAVAFVLMLSFAGPVVRPLGALVGGVGFGLFVDEIGKLVTSDYDYFYAPTAALVYIVVVGLALLAEALDARSRPVPAEQLAGATDRAVAGLAGGLTSRGRRHADEQADRGRGAPGYDEVVALVAAVPDGGGGLPDPVAWVSDHVVRTTRRLVRERWVPTVAVVVLVVAAALAVWRGLAADADAPRWAVVMLVAGGALTVVGCVVGLVVAQADRERGFTWFRRATLVSLLVTQVGLFRLDEWAAAGGLVLDLVVLGLVAAELDVLRRSPARVG
ncbi:hypothetical protein [Cellulomonas composti]|uniref:Uncharacterized protein n=1 Tax=Cellulomonas composti TaxID=266130 RepID=A0A511J6G4_9CELL|nr:hypothetical protein [Cellulomonas composti]GEL93585.1 hypothetical protein CCO02nite_02430 [Cellulomonas composti]